jgi:hypothetical protein
MVCKLCGQELPSDFKLKGFNFCPHCGKPANVIPSDIESPDPVSQLQTLTDNSTIQASQKGNNQSWRAIAIGTWVFGAFSALSLLVSIVKGIVPIYLLEAAIWAILAWYWQSKKKHSESAQLTVILLGILVVIGEIAHIALYASSPSQPKPPEAMANGTQDPWIAKYGVNSSSSSPKLNPDGFAMVDAYGFELVTPTSPPSCSSQMHAGEKARIISEIPLDQIEGSNGDLYITSWDTASSSDMFHFTILNKSKNFCVTSIEYNVELERDDGTLLKARGKKLIPGGTLSPQWRYTPQSWNEADSLRFSGEFKHGILSSWKITKVYGYLQDTSVSQ